MIRRSKDQHGRRRPLLSALGASAAASVLVLASTSLIAGSASAQTVTPHATSTAPCTVTVAAGTGQVAGNFIVGVSAGTTQIKLDCNVASQAALAIEASLFTSISSSNVIPTGEVDTSTLSQFAPSATDTGCPAATAGSCEIATVAVPAAYTAADPNAACPPTQAQINAGVYGCAIAAVTSADVPVPGAEFLLQYAVQTTNPNAPTIAAVQSTGSVGSEINISDAAGNTGYWWGNATQVGQALATGTPAQAPPSSCGTGGGYGNVPSTFLNVLWYAAGSATPILGSAAGVTISNDCYSGTTLSPPVLGGVTTVPAGVTVGTTYAVYLCELNLTPYQGTTTGPCGPAVQGLGWIEASFNFTPAAKVISQNLPEAGSATVSTAASFSAQLATSGNSGTVTFTQTTGAPTVTVSSSGAVTLSSTISAGTYTATGTTSDTAGDTGTFAFSVTLTGSTPPPPAPAIRRVVGHAVVRGVAIIRIYGVYFTKVKSVVLGGGSSARVRGENPHVIVIAVYTSAHARKGRIPLVIHFVSGKVCRGSLSILN